MPEPQYTIKTLKDMGQIPADRIDAFLVDLRSCLLAAHGLTDITDSFVKAIDPSVASTAWWSPSSGSTTERMTSLASIWRTTGTYSPVPSSPTRFPPWSKACTASPRSSAKTLPSRKVEAVQQHHPGADQVSLSERRHHRWRVIQNHIRAIRERWKTTAAAMGEAWVRSNARSKTNPFTSCSCEGCQCSAEHRAGHKRERRAAKIALRHFTED